jgi:1-acyl-sn-glycerol-3-phosphate acyltransferase
MIGRFEFRRRVPGRSAAAILWFDLGRGLVSLTLRILYRFRILDRRRLPRSGPVLVVANHASFLDPMVVGSVMKDRQFSPLARETLFQFKPFGWLLRSYGVIPINRDGADAAAMRTGISELKAGRCLALFPEGTRSREGALGEFRRGVLLLLRKAPATVVPMGIAGTHAAWPPGRSLPRWRGRIVAAVGTPIPSEELLALPPDEALGKLRSAVASEIARAEEATGRSRRS